MNLSVQDSTVFWVLTITDIAGIGIAAVALALAVTETQSQSWQRDDQDTKIVDVVDKGADTILEGENQRRWFPARETLHWWKVPMNIRRQATSLPPNPLPHEHRCHLWDRPDTNWCGGLALQQPIVSIVSHILTQNQLHSSIGSLSRLCLLCCLFLCRCDVPTTDLHFMDSGISLLLAGIFSKDIQPQTDIGEDWPDSTALAIQSCLYPPSYSRVDLFLCQQFLLAFQHSATMANRFILHWPSCLVVFFTPNNTRQPVHHCCLMDFGGKRKLLFITAMKWNLQSRGEPCCTFDLGCCINVSTFLACWLRIKLGCPYVNFAAWNLQDFSAALICLLLCCSHWCGLGWIQVLLHWSLFKIVCAWCCLVDAIFLIYVAADLAVVIQFENKNSSIQEGRGSLSHSIRLVLWNKVCDFLMHWLGSGWEFSPVISWF